MKKLIVLFAIGVALFALYGCNIGGVSPILTVTTNPSSGHPPFSITIAAACSMEDGTYTLAVQGQDPVLSINGAFTALVDTSPWKATVSWTDGSTVVNKPIVVAIENKRPVAHDLAFTPAVLNIGQGVWFDLRYRQAGCENGTPLRNLGIEDPDYQTDGYSAKNDNFTYHIDVYDDITDMRETVFKPDGTFLNADEFTATPYFKWFVGWSVLVSPFPFSPMCGASPAPPSSGSRQNISKRVEVSVKEFGNIYRFVYHITNGA